MDETKKAAAPVKGRRLSLQGGCQYPTGGGSQGRFIAPAMMIAVHAMTATVIRRWGQFIAG